MIKGDKIKLVPATLGDRRKIYEWCYQSETTKYHSGPPDYPDKPILTYEEFYASDEGGYTEYYFTGARPGDGRGFLIVSNDNETVGFVSYSAFHLKAGIAELDIWMDGEASCGKGFGVDALVCLGAYLHKEMGMRELIIAPALKNVRAVKAYEKAGFIKTDKAMDTFLRDEYKTTFGGGDYGVDETVILVKQFL